MGLKFKITRAILMLFDVRIVKIVLDIHHLNFKLFVLNVNSSTLSCLIKLVSINVEIPFSILMNSVNNQIQWKEMDVIRIAKLSLFGNVQILLCLHRVILCVGI